jgi:anti-anti-sigma factor
MPMTIEVTQPTSARPISVVVLVGELDASNYERLIEVIGLEWEGGSRGLVFDLAGLSFMASSGLVALYASERIFRGEGAPDLEAGWQVIHDLEEETAAAANIRLAAVQPSVERVLQRTGLSRLFPMDASADLAILALEGD